MSAGLVPRDPRCCSGCIEGGEPCSLHRGPDGKTAEYVGPDAYEPSDLVRKVMSHRYRCSHRGRRIWRCIGYDPRHGFWMETADGGPLERANISGRAIEATWHSVHLTHGAWTVARAIVSMGRMPTSGELPKVDVEGASKTLRDLGFLIRGQLTDDGRRAAEAAFVG